MVHRLNRLIFVILVVALALYVVMLNRDNISVHISSTNAVTTSLGVVLIAVFCLGIISTALVAFYFGIKAWWREQGLLARERQRQAFLQTMIRARAYLVSGESEKAGAEWQQVIKRDPTSIIARIELSHALQAAGEVREAAKIIDAARSVDPQNIEVLFRAAELNIALGNKTAAIDNLALVLYHHPVKRAATMARDLSEQLGRYEDALEYQTQLERLGVAGEEARAQILFKKALADLAINPTQLKEELLKLTKLYKRCSPALEKLAQLEKEAGNIDAAAQYFVKAAEVNDAPGPWQQAVRLWIDHRMPDRAVAAARAAVKDAQGSSRLEAELDLIQVYLELQMLEEARNAINAFQSLARKQGVELSSELEHRWLTLKGLCLHSLGLYRESSEVWRALANPENQILTTAGRVQPSHQEEPSPTFSTP